jgi:transposase-like protein
MENTMADELRIGLQELLRKAQMEGNVDFLREGVRVLAQALMEIEVEQHVGAGRHERTEGRRAGIVTAIGRGAGIRGRAP